MELDTLDKAIIPLLGLLVTGASLWLAHNYRRQMKVKLAETRLEAYAELWEITGIGAPTRLDGWGPGGHLTPDDRQRLYEAMADWYYGAGHGMLLTKGSRGIYLNAKHNLVCERIECLKPRGLDQHLPGVTDGDQQLRGILSIRQMSLLRSQLKADLAIYGKPYSGRLEEHEIHFLEGSGVNPASRAWRASSGYTRRSAAGRSAKRLIEWWNERRRDDDSDPCADPSWYQPMRTIDIGADVWSPPRSEAAVARGSATTRASATLVRGARSHLIA